MDELAVVGHAAADSRRLDHLPPLFEVRPCVEEADWVNGERELEDSSSSLLKHLLKGEGVSAE